MGFPAQTLEQRLESRAMRGIEAWQDALLVAELMLLDPVGLGGVHARGGPGPAREQWLQKLRDGVPDVRPMMRLPLNLDEARLIGGLDLAASLRESRPVLQSGLLVQADQGIVVAAMAERLPRRTVAQVCAALDTGEVALEREGLTARQAARFAVVALDEGRSEAGAAAEAGGPADGEEALAPALADRLAFRIDFDEIDWRHCTLLETEAETDLQTDPPKERQTEDRSALARARNTLALAAPRNQQVALLTRAAAALGISSLRAPLLALRAAMAHAALHGRTQPDDDDVSCAARLVLGHRATRLPSSQLEDTHTAKEPQPPNSKDAQDAPPPPEDSQADCTDETPGRPEPELEELPDDLVIAAAMACIPPGLLALLREGGPGFRSPGAPAPSRSGESASGGQRGRPVGVRAAAPSQGQRLSLIDTLRAAAPWQTIRRRALAERPGPRGALKELAHKVGAAQRIHVQLEDLRVLKLEQRRPSTTVFVVDASGSSALNRLAEAKGAVELLLADCYVRRDRVSVIGFRGKAAQTLLPPTRSLVRAKRSLAGLPGGGGTPVASAFAHASELSRALRRRGETVTVVVLSDGKANVTLNGTSGREAAHHDALNTARHLRDSGARCLFVDTSPQPQPKAMELAVALQARYVPLPHARSSQLSSLVRRWQA